MSTTSRNANARRLSAGSLIFGAIFFSGAMAQENHHIVPDRIKPPADQRLVLRGHASGVQIYTRQPSPRSDTQFSWVLSGPEAKLTDDNGKEIAKHFAGPTWQSTDGSQVRGKVANQTAPDLDSTVTPADARVDAHRVGHQVSSY